MDREKFLMNTDQSRKNKKNIKIKFIYAFVFFTIVLSAVLFYFFYEQYKLYIVNESSVKASRIKDLFYVYVKEKTEELDTVSDILERDTELKKIWLEDDRNKFLDHFAFIERILKQNDINNICFIRKDRSCFIRSDNIGKFNDVRDDNLLKRAETSISQVSEIKISKPGSFIIRTIHPWYIDHTFQGYIEIEKNIDSIFEHIKKIFDVDILLFFPKNKLNSEALNEKWITINEFNINTQYSKIKDVDKSFAEKGEKKNIVLINNEFLIADTISLDENDNGVFLMFYENVTREHYFMFVFFSASVFIILMIIFAAVVIFNYYCRYLDRTSESLRNELEIVDSMLQGQRSDNDDLKEKIAELNDALKEKEENKTPDNTDFDVSAELSAIEDVIIYCINKLKEEIVLKNINITWNIADNINFEMFSDKNRMKNIMSELIKRSIELSENSNIQMNMMYENENTDTVIFSVLVSKLLFSEEERRKLIDSENECGLSVLTKGINAEIHVILHESETEFICKYFIRPIFSIDQLKVNLGDDLLIINEVIRVFLDAMPKMLEELKKAMREYEIEDVIRLCHSIKGSCATLTAESMKDVAFKMEKSARKRDIKSVYDSFEQLEREYNELTEKLVEYR